ncbi:hypothetical protein KZ820_14445 [Sphingomonas sp. RRHST34]|uniref:Uncharacterized protein n=1 Tax=Sphingomonas citri TaxID=2862499 RepID=A0ABS7BQS6_9SPHN|nr:hypothetical protein [Sphingomonas citri]MBW6531938.1 hypothetical protein [Sphingomonas citri]
MRAAIIAIALLAVIGFAAAIFGPRACSRAQQTAAAAQADSARSDAMADAAIGAAADTASAMTTAAVIAATSKEHEDAIRSAPGAATAVPAPSNGAALRALCLRPSYRDQPRCVALLGPGAGAAGR